MEIPVLMMCLLSTASGEAAVFTSTPASPTYGLERSPYGLERSPYGSGRPSVEVRPLLESRVLQWVGVGTPPTLWRVPRPPVTPAWRFVPGVSSGSSYWPNIMSAMARSSRTGNHTHAAVQAASKTAPADQTNAGVITSRFNTPTSAEYQVSSASAAPPLTLLTDSPYLPGSARANLLTDSPYQPGAARTNQLTDSPYQPAVARTNQFTDSPYQPGAARANQLTDSPYQPAVASGSSTASAAPPLTLLTDSPYLPEASRANQLTNSPYQPGAARANQFTDSPYQPAVARTNQLTDSLYQPAVARANQLTDSLYQPAVASGSTASAVPPLTLLTDSPYLPGATTAGSHRRQTVTRPAAGLVAPRVPTTTPVSASPVAVAAAAAATVARPAAGLVAPRVPTTTAVSLSAAPAATAAARSAPPAAPLPPAATRRSGEAEPGWLRVFSVPASGAYLDTDGQVLATGDDVDLSGAQTRLGFSLQPAHHAPPTHHYRVEYVAESEPGALIAGVPPHESQQTHRSPAPRRPSPPPRRGFVNNMLTRLFGGQERQPRPRAPFLQRPTHNAFEPGREPHLQPQQQTTEFQQSNEVQRAPEFRETTKFPRTPGFRHASEVQNTQEFQQPSEFQQEQQFQQNPGFRQETAALQQLTELQQGSSVRHQFGSQQSLDVRQSSGLLPVLQLRPPEHGAPQTRRFTPSPPENGADTFRPVSRSSSRPPPQPDVATQAATSSTDRVDATEPDQSTDDSDDDDQQWQVEPGTAHLRTSTDSSFQSIDSTAGAPQTVASDSGLRWDPEKRPSTVTGRAGYFQPPPAPNTFLFPPASLPRPASNTFLFPPASLPRPAPNTFLFQSARLPRPAPHAASKPAGPLLMSRQKMEQRDDGTVVVTGALIDDPRSEDVVELVVEYDNDLESIVDNLLREVRGPAAANDERPHQVTAPTTSELRRRPLTVQQLDERLGLAHQPYYHVAMALYDLTGQQRRR